ncbi:MAG: hypothetical protein JEY99_08075 [Spirochaetales bacterium]|nr:hypothetical protein [Spirochaetales bacterium]
MKKGFYFLLTLLVFWGCASQSENLVVEETGTEEEKAPTEAVAEEISNEPASVVLIDVQVPHPLKETRFFRDGSVDTWIEYVYETESAVLLTRSNYNSDGSLISVYNFENIDGKPVKREELDGNGRLSGYETYGYDESGHMIRKSTFNSEDVAQIVSEYTWNSEGDMIKLSVLDGNNGLLSYVEYTFEDGLPVMSTLYGADGEKTNYFEKEYNSDRLLVRETDYSASGNVDGFVDYSYENGFLVMEEHKNRGGGLVRKYLYENDEYGNPLKVSLENNKGITLEMVEKTYFYTTEQIVAE